MLEKIKEIAKEYTEAEINLNTNIKEDLLLTSFDIISLVGDIEEAFEIEIPEEELLNIVTIEDLIKCIETKKK